MREEFDFSKAKRVKDVPHLAALQAAGKGKTRITIMLDDNVIEIFRKRAEAAGRGYQTLINEALKTAAFDAAAPVTLKSLRRVLREELVHAAA
jgi:uncharacterized protein (DUF4415 family)